MLRADWLTTGPNVAQFEEAFAAQVEAKFAVAVCNGSAALYAAGFAAGIVLDDEVIAPAGDNPWILTPDDMREIIRSLEAL